MFRFNVLFVCVAVMLAATAANADVIASTDFNGRIVSGATASSLNWVTSGVGDPGNLTAAATGYSVTLFDTTDAAGRFAVNHNFQFTGTPWTVDVPLAVGAADIAIGTVTLDAFIYNGSGVLQTQGRDLDVSAQLIDAADQVLASDSVLNVYSNSDEGSPVQPQAVVLDLSGPVLLANQTYRVRVLFGSNETRGNNGGFDNLVINSTAIPEPAALAGMVAAGLLVLVRRR